MSVSEHGLVSTCVRIYPNNCTFINEISMRTTVQPNSNLTEHACGMSST